MAPAESETLENLLSTKTKTATRDEVGGRRQVVAPALTILAHYDPGRIGEVAWLADLARGRSVEISRRAPSFRAPDGGAERPLAEPRLSRRPLRIAPLEDGLRIDPSESSTQVEIDGHALDGPKDLSDDDLARGVVLLLGRRVTLLLRAASPTLRPPPRYGLVGDSPAMLRLRAQIESVADLEVPILLRGESGTGKELVARAIQSRGPRRDAPFFSLNMGAMPPALAAAELFGAAKGAYSGADRPRQGFFRRAHGGTLFLDEIGETPLEVQALLLRVLESGEVQPLGEENTRRVDVRIIAATDADLEEGVRQASFRSALLQRLRGFEIALPPLRDRREDLGRLFCHFLRAELEALGQSERLRNRGPYEKPFIPAGLLAAMALYTWPGNVRELRNAVRQIVIASRKDSQLRAEEWPTPRTPARPAPPEIADPPSDEGDEPEGQATHRRTYRDPSDVDDDELLEVLREERWNLKATAQRLGVSRGSLYVLIESHPGVRKASELTRDEIEAAIEQVGRGVDELVVQLGVSKQALKRRLSQLKLS